MQPRQAILIARGHSRRGRDAYETMPGLLRERGIEVIDSFLVEKRKDACKAVKRALKTDVKLLVVCGGDGTQTSIVPMLANSKRILGVVPAGTGNSFALGLGISSFEDAADAIAYGRERKVDLGIVNGTYFANFLTIGLAAQIGKKTSRGLKSLIGPAAYGAAAVVPIITHKPFKAVIRWKKHRVKADTHQIIVASGRFYGHQPLAPGATLSDGRMTVFVRDDTSKLDLLQTYWALIRGEQQSLSGVHLWSTSGKVTIETDPNSPVAIDGRAFGKTPIKLQVAHNALRVMEKIDVAKAS